MTKSITLTPKDIERFWSKVDRKGDDDCWDFKAKRRTHYGSFYLKSGVVGAHRVSWVIANEEIPDDLEVLHSCDNVLCCNPKHLSLGTHLQNMEDMKIKGRQNTPADRPSGNLHPNSKISDAAVAELRSRYKSGEYTLSKLASLYGISTSQTHNIVKRYQRR